MANKRGGKRPGAGRKKSDRPNQFKIRISDQARGMLETFSEELNRSKSSLTDSLIIFYLGRENKDFTFCQKCGKACNFKPEAPVLNWMYDKKNNIEDQSTSSKAKCQHCGHEFEVEY